MPQLLIGWSFEMRGPDERLIPLSCLYVTRILANTAISENRKSRICAKKIKRCHKFWKKTKEQKHKNIENQSKETSSFTLFKKPLIREKQMKVKCMGLKFYRS